MSVLLIAEHDNKEVKPFTLNAVTAASQIDKDLHVLVIGHNSESVAKSLSEVPNVKKVLHADNEIYYNYLAENFTPVIVKQAENYSHIVCSANTFGKKNNSSRSSSLRKLCGRKFCTSNREIGRKLFTCCLFS